MAMAPRTSPMATAIPAREGAEGMAAPAVPSRGRKPSAHEEDGEDTPRAIAECGSRLLADREGENHEGEISDVGPDRQLAGQQSCGGPRRPHNELPVSDGNLKSCATFPPRKASRSRTAVARSG